MRLDFNVLWVEDQQGYVRSQQRPIKRHMEEHGFELRVAHCQTIDEVKAKIASDVFDDEFDLVLVDWDLGQGPSGDEVRGQTVIQVIREKIPFKDIVFYSGETEIGQLRKFAYEAAVEGIFFSRRGDLVDEVKDVFDSLVKKVLDLDHTRGIVMGATSDIDFIVNECLKHAHGKLDAAGQKSLVASALKLINGQMAKLREQVDGLRGVESLDPLFEAHGVFQSYDRLRLLAGILKLDAFVAHKGARESVTGYMEQVVPYRNIFAHTIAEPGAPKKILDNKGKAIDLDRAREIRQAILNLRREFRGLLDALQASG